MDRVVFARSYTAGVLQRSPLCQDCTAVWCSSGVRIVPAVHRRAFRHYRRMWFHSSLKHQRHASLRQYCNLRSHRRDWATRKMYSIVCISDWIARNRLKLNEEMMLLSVRVHVSNSVKPQSKVWLWRTLQRSFRISSTILTFDLTASWPWLTTLLHSVDPASFNLNSWGRLSSHWRSRPRIHWCTRLLAVDSTTAVTNFSPEIVGR